MSRSPLQAIRTKDASLRRGTMCKKKYNGANLFENSIVERNRAPAVFISIRIRNIVQYILLLDDVRIYSSEEH